MSLSKLLMGCAFASVAATANAADLSARKSPIAPAPLANSWTGFYVGATTGYNFFTKAGSAKPNGALLGLRVGYDHQIAPTFVIGVLVDGELDFGKKSYSGTYLGTPYRASLKHTQSYSIDLKAGYLVNDQTMIYALGGFTNGKVKASASVGAISASDSFTANGWNLGLGTEYRFTKQWSAFGEYRFNQLKKDGVTINVGQAKIGVAYRF